MNNTNKNKIIRVEENNKINLHIIILLEELLYTLKLNFCKIIFSFLNKKYCDKNINESKEYDMQIFKRCIKNVNLVINYINFLRILSIKGKKSENRCIYIKKKEKMQNRKVKQICII